MPVRTLLFLGAVGLDRTWDLRSYTGDGLGVLTGRPRAYGYFHAERFLSQIAQANGADTFTDGLAQWTARLWNPPTAPTQEVEPLYYISRAATDNPPALDSVGTLMLPARNGAL